MSEEICPHGYGASGDTCVMIMDDKECLCAVIEERDRLRGAIEDVRDDLEAAGRDGTVAHFKCVTALISPKASTCPVCSDNAFHCAEVAGNRCPKASPDRASENEQ